MWVKAQNLCAGLLIFIDVFFWEKQMQIGLEKTRVELKYCECCGALWLRRSGGNESTCVVCEELWNDLPGAWIERVLGKQAVLVAGGRA